LEDTSSDEEEHQWQEKWEEEEEVLVEEVAHIPIKSKTSKTKTMIGRNPTLGVSLLTMKLRKLMVLVKKKCMMDPTTTTMKLDLVRKIATLITPRKPLMTTRRTRRTKMDWN
jgi:acetylglutamate synthase